MKVQELKPLMADLLAEVSENTDVKSSAVTLLGTLGQLILDNVADKAIVTELATSMTGAKGTLDASNASMAAAIAAHTPVADIPLEVNRVNQAGADNGIGQIGDIISNDDANLASYKSAAWVDTTTI
jgi:hypothetical protein